MNQSDGDDPDRGGLDGDDTDDARNENAGNFIEGEDDNSDTGDDITEGAGIFHEETNMPEGSEMTGDTGNASVSEPEYALAEEEDEDLILTEHDISWWENPEDASGKNFVISTADQLQGFVYLVNNGKSTFSGSTVTLAGDIDLGEILWEPIGFSAAYSFAGTFDGAGSTISGLTLQGSDACSGLFGYLRGTVRNLKLKDVEITVENTAARTFVGAAAGCTSGVLSDIEVSGSVSVSAPSDPSDVYVGGAAGYVEGASADGLVNRASVTITSQENAAEIFAGGVLGFCGADTALYNCGNTGAISASARGDIHAGGIAGDTDTAAVRNCYNQGSLTATSATGHTAYAGGLLGTFGGSQIFNCYNNNRSIKGNAGYYAYVAGCVTSADAPDCQYVYWPGTAGSTTAAGSKGTSLNIATSCMAIGKITGTSLTKRLNARVVAVYDEESSDNLCMWKAEGNAVSDPPEFRTEALSPIFPTLPQLTAENTEVSMHAAVNSADGSLDGAENTASDNSFDSSVLNVAVRNDDSAVSHTFQWQKSEDGDHFTDIADAGQSFLTVTAGAPEIAYYRLMVVCGADYADAPKTVYSDPIRVTIGWQITFADGGMRDGSGAVTADMLPEALFPVTPESGGIALSKASSSGNYFLGWVKSYTDGQSLNEEPMNVYDTSELDGDLTLYAVFRPAGTMNITLEKGDENAFLSEGAEESSLYLSAEEGDDFILPDGNDYFTYEGYRFMGWKITAAEESPADGENIAAGDEEENESSLEDEENSGSINRLWKAGEIYIAGDTDITLTAVWSKLYRVTFTTGVSSSASTADDADAETGGAGTSGNDTSGDDGNGSSSDNAAGTTLPAAGVQGQLPDSFEAVEGEVITLPAADGLNYEGYLFKNWKISYVYSADGEEKTKTSYVNAQGYFTMPAADITAAAQWGTKLTVVFQKKYDDDSVSVTGDVPETMECLAGSEITLPECAMVRESFRFSGWYDDIYGDIWQPGSSYTVLYDTTFFADWTAQYTVSFDRGSITLDDGTEGVITGETPKSYVISEDEKIVLPENPFTPPEAEEGYYYRFVGWQYGFTLYDSVIYSAGASCPIKKVSGENKTAKFTAVWKKAVEWNGTAAESFQGGTGTEDDPYLISNADELAKLASDVNKGKHYDGQYFLVTEDIDLNQRLWSFVGYGDTTYFSGVLDGGGHTVSGLKIDTISDSYVGLFGYTKNAQISDLNLENVEITAENSRIHVGALVGYMMGGRISECSVSGKIEAKDNDTAEVLTYDDRDGSSAGGLVGTALGDVEIDGCVNTASVGDRILNVGGIAGLAGYSLLSASGNIRISGCENEGSIATAYENSPNLGGIVGKLWAPDGEMTDCENRGDVAVTIEINRRTSYCMGGIAGIAGVGINAENCRNSGSVKGFISLDSGDVERLNLDSFDKGWDASDSQYMRSFYVNTFIGGIIGVASEDSVRECINAGTVTAEMCEKWNTSYQSFSTGGITGLLYKGTISDCLNSADIVSSDTVSYRNEESIQKWPHTTGGIAGGAAGECSIEYSCDTGQMKATANNPEYISSGMIIGAYELGTYYEDEDGAVTLTSCYAPADETGLFGSYYSDWVTLQNSSAKSAEQFASGEVAYLLGYSGLIDRNGEISEESGGRVDRGMWTQSGQYPALGSPSVLPVRVGSVEAGSITLGNACCSGLDTLYAAPGSTVYVTTDADDKSQSVSQRTETETVENGTWYYTYQDIEANSLNEINVRYEDGADSEEETLTSKTFSMKVCEEAVVSALMKKEVISRLVASVFVEKDEEEPLPPEKENSGSGGGKGNGSGNGSDPGKQEGNGGNGNNPISTDPGTPQGGGTPGVSSPVISDHPSDAASVVMVPAAAEAVSDVIADVTSTQPEAAATPDSGGSGQQEEVIEEEPVQEDMAVFEVIQDTIKTNWFVVFLLILVLIVLLAVGGYSRYRKSRGRRIK